MNYYLLISGILTIVMGIAHSIIGERSIMIPLQKSEGLPAVRGSARNTKLTLRFTWHVTSVLGFGTAIILFSYCKLTTFNPDQVFIIRTLSITYFISFLVSIIGSEAKHPSWIIFILVSILTWLSTGS